MSHPSNPITVSNRFLATFLLAIAACANAEFSMPPLCEILDFNRDIVFDKNDETDFGLCRTGRAAGSSGGGVRGHGNLDDRCHDYRRTH